MMTKKDFPLSKLLKLRHSWIAWVVVAVAVITTLLLWQLSIRLVEDRTEARFRTQSLQLRTAIEERLLNYEQVLAGSAGLFTVTGDVSREQWRQYVSKRSEEHTSELQSRPHLVCRLLLEKKKKKKQKQNLIT